MNAAPVGSLLPIPINLVAQHKVVLPVLSNSMNRTRVEKALVSLSRSNSYGNAPFMILRVDPRGLRKYKKFLQRNIDFLSRVRDLDEMIDENLHESDCAVTQNAFYVPRCSLSGEPIHFRDLWPTSNRKVVVLVRPGKSVQSIFLSDTLNKRLTDRGEPYVDWYFEAELYQFWIGTKSIVSPTNMKPLLDANAKWTLDDVKASLGRIVSYVLEHPEEGLNNRPSAWFLRPKYRSAYETLVSSLPFHERRISEEHYMRRVEEDRSDGKPSPQRVLVWKEGPKEAIDNELFNRGISAMSTYRRRTEPSMENTIYLPPSPDGDIPGVWMRNGRVIRTEPSNSAFHPDMTFNEPAANKKKEEKEEEDTDTDNGSTLDYSRPKDEPQQQREESPAEFLPVISVSRSAATFSNAAQPILRVRNEDHRQNAGPLPPIKPPVSSSLAKYIREARYQKIHDVLSESSSSTQQWAAEYAAKFPRERVLGVTLMYIGAKDADKVLTSALVSALSSGRMNQVEFLLSLGARPIAADQLADKRCDERDLRFLEERGYIIGSSSKHM